MNKKEAPSNFPVNRDKLPEGGGSEAQQIKWMVAEICTAQKSPLRGDLPARRRQGGALASSYEEPIGDIEE